MKKIIISAAMGSLLFVAAMADQTVVNAHEEAQPIDVAEETCGTASDQPAFGGLSVMLGIGGNFFEAKDKGLFQSKDLNRFMETIGIGAGKVFNNKFYAGVDFLCDFTKTEKYHPTAARDLSRPVAANGAPVAAGYRKGDEIKEITAKLSGIMPSLGVKLGYVFPNSNTMAYMKISAIYNRFSLTAAKLDQAGAVQATPGGTVKKNIVSPAIAIGIEKVFSKKLSARLEGEYVIGTKKTYEMLNKVYSAGTFPNNANDLLTAQNDTTAKLKVSGFNVRALVSYNINL